MKILLIKASAPGRFKDHKQQVGSPPQNIWSVAAATGETVDLEVIDETANQAVPKRTAAALVAIFMPTPDAPRGSELADRFHRQGKTVVIGGYTPAPYRMRLPGIAMRC